MIGKIDMKELERRLREKFEHKPFGNLYIAGFRHSYKRAQKAMQYYDSDPEVSCEWFRHLLESILEDAYKIIGFDTIGGMGTDIKALANSKYGELLPDEIFDEMMTVKNLSSYYYVHEARTRKFSDFRKRDPLYDRKTLYVGLIKISDWLVKFKETFPEWNRERIKQEEEQCQQEKKAAWWIGGGTLAAIIVGSLFSMKN